MKNNAKNAVAQLAGLVVAFLMVAPVTAQAQTEILHACYMPATGVMYLIKRSGLPDACRSDDHVEIAFQMVSSGDAAAAPPPGTGGGPPVGAGPQIVQSLNTLTGDLTLAAQGGATISDNGTDVITINAGDGHSLDAADGSSTDALFVDNDGNVGIGTTSPQQQLHVKANGGDSEIRIEGSTTGVASTARVSFYNSTPTRIGYMGDASSGNDDIIFVADANNSLRFFTNPGTVQERLTIDASGNVGIGTTSPGTKFEVAGQVKITGGTPGSGKVLTSDAAGLATWQTPSSGGDPSYGSSAASPNDAVFVNDDGNVGIGTTNPVHKLEVAGDYAGILLTGWDNRITFGGRGTNKDAEIFQWQDTGNGFAIYSGTDPDEGGNNAKLHLYSGSRSSPAHGLTVDAAGNVGIGTTSPTTLLEVACPPGFTNVKRQNNQLGCIQNNEASFGFAIWEAASDYCFDNYGGRLPTTGEWYISAANYALANEIDNWEWNDDAMYNIAADVHAVSGNGRITTSVASNDVNGWRFRCWIPR